MPDDAAPLDASPWEQVARLMDGYLVTQLLYVAAKLGIAEALGAGPLGADLLAGAVRADADALRRVLRGLAAEGLLDEHPDGRFGLTPLGMRLHGDAPGSQPTARSSLRYGLRGLR